MPSPNKRAVVLMSGGVDSSVAAGLLLREGYEVTGATFILGKDAHSGGGDIEDARRAAAGIGIPHRVADLTGRFDRTVVKPFLEAYSRGRTPNPCVICNPLVKFAAGLELAEELGAGKIATGHYARLQPSPDGAVRVRKGADPSRDQSYFLYRLPQNILRRAIFPLGGLSKQEVRSLAGEMGLSLAGKKDSQEICFIPGGNLSAFLKSRIAPESRRPGAVITTQGRVIGRHDGIHSFTIGQRRGLGVAAGRPLYVIGIDPEEGTVTVGGGDELASAAMLVGDLHWAAGPPPGESFRALVRIRQKHREAWAVIRISGSSAAVAFDHPQRAVTPGQSAVFYDSETVLGGGIIEGPVQPGLKEAGGHGP